MEIEITPVDRGTVHIDVNRVVEGFVTASADDSNPDLVYAEGPVYNLVIDHPEATVLWDTGCHPDATDGYWPDRVARAFGPVETRPLADDLDAAGYDLADVDLVVQSHLHMDHAGGLRAFEGTDTPVVVHEAELSHAHYATATDRELAYVRADFDRDLAWEVVHGRRTHLLGGVELLHFPGHTPGLLGVLVERGGEGIERGGEGVERGRDGTVGDGDATARGGEGHDPLLLTGDLAYVAANYEHEHPLGAGLLWSKRDWFDSLHRAKDVARRNGATVIYGHDPEQVARFDELLEVGS